MRIFGFVAAATAILTLTGCATTGDQVRVDPERSIVIKAPAKDVKAGIASMMIAKGFTIKQDTDFLLSFDEPSTNFAANFLLSSRFDPTVDDRVTFQIVGDNPTTVAWHSYFVTNPGTGFEQLTENTNNPGMDSFEQALDQVAADVEMTPAQKKHLAALNASQAQPS